MRQGRTLTTQTVTVSCPRLMKEYIPDGIDWHYDSNHFRGRFFTMIIPVPLPRGGVVNGNDKDKDDDGRSSDSKSRSNAKCAHFRYMDDGSIHAPRRTREEDTAVLFEGENVYHGSTRACEGDAPVSSSVSPSPTTTG